MLIIGPGSDPISLIWKQKSGRDGRSVPNVPYIRNFPRMPDPLRESPCKRQYSTVYASARGCCFLLSDGGALRQRRVAQSMKDFDLAGAVAFGLLKTGALDVILITWTQDHVNSSSAS
jgi:hypothetical protein